MQHLNLNLIRSLAVLLEERNVTAAAARLHLTQSALSRQLGQLRACFADPLLIRVGNEYLLSARAEQLQPKIQGILAEIATLGDEQRFDPAQCRRRFSFACTDYVAQLIFPAVLERLHREAPLIDIRYEMWHPEWLDQLGQRPLDLVSTTLSELPESLQSIPIGQDHSVCLMAANHPLRAQPAPTLEALLAYPFVQLNSGGDKDSFLDRALEAEGRHRRILLEVPFFSAAFAVIVRSQALMVVPAHIAQNAASAYPLSYAPLPLPTPENRYHLCWHARHARDPAHRWIRQCIAEELRASMYAPPGPAQP